MRHIIYHIFSRFFGDTYSPFPVYTTWNLTFFSVTKSNLRASKFSLLARGILISNTPLNFSIFQSQSFSYSYLLGEFSRGEKRVRGIRARVMCRKEAARLHRDRSIERTNDRRRTDEGRRLPPPPPPPPPHGGHATRARARARPRTHAERKSEQNGRSHLNRTCGRKRLLNIFVRVSSYFAAHKDGPPTPPPRHVSSPPAPSPSPFPSPRMTYNLRRLRFVCISLSLPTYTRVRRFVVISYRRSVFFFFFFFRFLVAITPASRPPPSCSPLRSKLRSRGVNCDFNVSLTGMIKYSRKEVFADLSYYDLFK